MSKQSSIEWLDKQMQNQLPYILQDDIIEQAKEMHKQEIIAAFKSGLASPYHQDYAIVTQKEEGTKSGQYYNETYGGDNV